MGKVSQFIFLALVCVTIALAARSRSKAAAKYESDSLITCDDTTEYTACDISNGACFTKLSCTSINYCIAMCSNETLTTTATYSCFTSVSESGTRQRCFDDTDCSSSLYCASDSPCE